VYARFPDCGEVLGALKAATAAYIASGRLTVARIIHGDCWFANIILTPSNELRFVDMRGLVGQRLTLCGDPTYDWAKILQSVLGFDELVFSLERAPLGYRATLASAYGALLRGAGVATGDVAVVCAGLVAGCLPFYEEEAVRAALWDFARQILNPTPGSDITQLLAAFQGTADG